MLHNYIITAFQNVNLMKSVGSAAALDTGYLPETDLMRLETVYPPGSDMPKTYVRL